jgi:hypothetical protein
MVQPVQYRCIVICVCLADWLINYGSRLSCINVDYIILLLLSSSSNPNLPNTLHPIQFTKYSSSNPIHQILLIQSNSPNTLHPIQFTKYSSSNPNATNPCPIPIYQVLIQSHYSPYPIQYIPMVRVQIFQWEMLFFIFSGFISMFLALRSLDNYQIVKIVLFFCYSVIFIQPVILFAKFNVICWPN